MPRMLTALLLVLPFCSSESYAQQQPAARFARQSFSTVIITETDYPGPEPSLPPGWEPGKPLPAAFVNAPDDSNRARLSAAEADGLYSRLVSPTSYRPGAAICFEPRLDAYFLRGDTLVNHVAVCADGGKIVATPYLWSN